jgi:hypothetical protein
MSRQIDREYAVRCCKVRGEPRHVTAITAPAVHKDQWPFLRQACFIERKH